MTNYALVITATGDVLGVYAASAAPSSAPPGAEFRELVSAKVPAGGGGGQKLRESGGALVWHDWRTFEEVQAAKWAEVHAKRDALLRESDWRAIYAADRGGQAAADWARSPWRDYRQELRNITNQPDPLNIVWPVPPTE